MPDGQVRRHPAVASVEGEGGWFVARVPDGPIHCLEGPAALIWDEIVGDEGDAGRSGGLVERVALRVHLEPDAVRDDVQGFVARLVALGLVEPVTPESR